MTEMTPALKRYVNATALAMGLYTLSLLYWGANLALGREALPPLAALLAAASSIGIVFHLWTLLRLVWDSDEFMRLVMAKRLLAAAMIVVGGLTIWGLMRQIGLLPELPLQFVYLGYFVIHAGLIPLINADRA